MEQGSLEDPSEAQKPVLGAHFLGSHDGPVLPPHSPPPPPTQSILRQCANGALPWSPGSAVEVPGSSLCWLLEALFFCLFV